MLLGSDAIIITKDEARQLLAAIGLIPSTDGPTALNKQLIEVGALNIVSDLKQAVREGN